MPARVPPHKTITQDPGCEHRLAMCRLLVGDREGLTVCALEAERDGPSYTVDTLNHVHASQPQAELTLIVGADIVSTLATWREPQRIVELASVAVAARPGSDRCGIAAALGQVSERARVKFLDAPAIDISSSLARQRSAAGEAIEGLVGNAVASYISEHGLYGARMAAAS
jgi:nicotinate-nucleotide adenylyltransferase